MKAFRNDPAAICCGLGKGKEVKETGVPRSVFKYLRYVPNGIGPEAAYSLDYAYLPFGLQTMYEPTHCFSVFIRF